MPVLTTLLTYFTLHYYCSQRDHSTQLHAPWTPLAESSRENSASAVCSGALLSSWYGATIPGWVTALNHWCWCSSPPQIGQHVYSLRTVNSPVHTWRPRISGGCYSCLEQPATWCQIYDVLGRVLSATQQCSSRCMDNRTTTAVLHWLT